MYSNKNAISSKIILPYRLFLLLASNLIVYTTWFLSCSILYFKFDISTKTAMIIYGIAAMSLIAKISLDRCVVLFGPAYVIMIYTIISFFGYCICAVFLPEETYNYVLNNRHSYIEYFNEGFARYYLACIFFIIGSHASRIYKKSHGSLKNNSVSNKISDKARKVYITIAIVVIYSYAAFLIRAILSGELPLTNYASAKAWFGTQSMASYLLKLVWICIPTVLYIGSKRDYKILAFPIIVIFIILMFTGNRNDILYPLAIAFGVYVYKRKKVPKLMLLVAVLIVFVLNPLISRTRQTALFVIEGARIDVIESLMEMGHQINPFSITLYLLDNGINYMYGLSLIIPTVSVLSLNTIWGTDYFLSSLYNPSVLLNNLGHYGLGFSCAAELYLNFGDLGIILLYFIFGMLCSKIEMYTVNQKKILFYFQSGTFFMIWARNTLQFSIVILIFAVIISVVVNIITKSKNI